MEQDRVVLTVKLTELGLGESRYYVRMFAAAEDLHGMTTGAMDANLEDGLLCYYGLKNRLAEWEEGNWRGFDTAAKRVFEEAVADYERIDERGSGMQARDLSMLTERGQKLDQMLVRVLENCEHRPRMEVFCEESS